MRHQLCVSFRMGLWLCGCRLVFAGRRAQRPRFLGLLVLPARKALRGLLVRKVILATLAHKGHKAQRVRLVLLAQPAPLALPPRATQSVTLPRPLPASTCGCRPMVPGTSLT